MSARRRHGLGIDEEACQKALDGPTRLLDEGDDSDTTCQDDLPEAPDLPEDPGDTIVVVIPSAGRETEPTDHPRQQIMQMAQEALDRRGPGAEIHFQFTCPACGSRCTMEEANLLFERGECYACGTDSPIEQAGFLLTMGPTVGPLTPPVGNA